MKVHPLYIVCILVRLIILFSIRFFYKNKTLKNLAVIMLCIMGMGFIYKGYTGSNNEIQIAKVFWHDSRYIHGILYLLASYYLYKNKININSALLGSDICFSLIYRILIKK